MPELWCIAPGQELARWAWNDEFVLYNNLSGDTHLLDSDSMALLEQLRLAPASIATLLAAFADEIDPDDPTALPDNIVALLTQLKGLHLLDSTVQPC